VLVLVLALSAIGATAGGAAFRAGQERPPGTWCGGKLWQLMTLSDGDRGRVQLEPTTTTIAEIAKLRPPASVTSTRKSAFVRRAWTLRTVIDRYRVASNGEIIMILYSIDSAQFMDAYMPDPRCLPPGTRNRAAIVAARNAFVGACPRPTPEWQLSGITVELSGVGFWNPVTTTRGALPNGAELRPLTGFKLVVGCGTS
jgi:hypothetical protein